MTETSCFQARVYKYDSSGKFMVFGTASQRHTECKNICSSLVFRVLLVSWLPSWRPVLLVSSLLNLWRYCSLVNLSSLSKIYSHRKTNQLLRMCCHSLHISTRLPSYGSATASENLPCPLYTCKSQEQSKTIHLHLAITVPILWTQYSSLLYLSQIFPVPSSSSHL